MLTNFVNVEDLFSCIEAVPVSNVANCHLTFLVNDKIMRVYYLLLGALLADKIY